MALRVERLAHDAQLGYAVAAEKIEHRPKHHLDALDDRLAVATAACSRDRTFEVVDNRQQVAEEVLPLKADALFALLAHPLPGVIGIGEGAQVIILKLGSFLLFPCPLPPYPS